MLQHGWLLISPRLSNFNEVQLKNIDHRGPDGSKRTGKFQKKQQKREELHMKILRIEHWAGLQSRETISINIIRTRKLGIEILIEK